jgi:UDP-2,4-diacetamido-2,4,6-trideoxy-beta-L-altropyranose hydrolase
MTLAEELEKRGHDIFFFTSSKEDDFKLFYDKKFDYEFSHEERTVAFDFSCYKTWMQRPLSRDAFLLNQYIEKIGIPDIVIVDHYSCDRSWFDRVNCKFIFLIDDVPCRDTSVQMILNQNSDGYSEEYVKRNGSKNVILLEGPRYSLLKEDFKNNYNKLDKEIDILVFFGGSDLTSESIKVVKSYLSLNLSYKMTVILSSRHKTYCEIEKMISTNENITLVSFVSGMSLTLANSKFAFGACGTSCWERAATQIPSATILVAENQEAIRDYLVNNDVCHFVGDGRYTGEKDWNYVFTHVLRNDELISKYITNSKKIPDARGCQKVASVIEDCIGEISERS